MKCLFILFSLLPAVSFGHMEMYFPAPIRSKYNPNHDYSEIDYSYNNPLGEYPCKGYHLDQPQKSVEKFKVGENYTLSLMGKATHHGGSCQISLSYDKGNTFTVIKSIIGGCPIDLDYDFEIPESAPSGQALFSWSWINRSANRDFYHNCAWVDIVNSKNPDSKKLQGPPMFIAQLPGNCTVPEGREFVYPDPGPNVQYGGDSKHYSKTCDFQDHRKDKNNAVFFDYDDKEDDDVDSIYKDGPDSGRQRLDDMDIDDDDDDDNDDDK